MVIENMGDAVVVEDAAAVRELTEQILKAHGYQVLSAAGGAQALRISKEYAGPIHLLLTDTVMPHMNGRELAEKLQTQRRETRILYMSGHHDDVVACHGVVGPDALFLPKPLTLESLTRKVREALRVCKRISSRILPGKQGRVREVVFLQTLSMEL